MEAQATEEILRFFRDVPDPRAGNAWHPLSDVMTIAILAVFCGSRGWADVGPASPLALKRAGRRRTCRCERPINRPASACVLLPASTTDNTFNTSRSRRDIQIRSFSIPSRQ